MKDHTFFKELDWKLVELLKVRGHLTNGTKNVNLLLPCFQSFLCGCGRICGEHEFWRRWEWWPCDRNFLIAGVMCNISHIQLIGKVVTSFKVYIRRFRNEKRTGPSYVSQRLLGLLLRTGGKIGQ